MASRSLTIEELERWVDFGASWRVVWISAELATVEMRECTGELVERRDTTDPAVIEYLRTHAAKQD